MPEFIPALELSRAYYWEAVRPVMDEHFPSLPHSAALIGYGSDVLGFDTPVSRDHMWGPRLFLFLPSPGFDEVKHALLERLRYALPTRFRGYSTHFSQPDPRDGGVRVMVNIDQGPVDPLIFFHTLDDFWHSHLGISPSQEIDAAAWLTFPEQKLIELTAGQVYHDDLGIEAARNRFAYYPHQVWLYLLAAQWELIAQEEAFVGRTAQVGDELGSRIIAARVVNHLMRLCFLMEKRYAPYSKWFGTAFQQLRCAKDFSPALSAVLAAADYPERDSAIARAYTLAAEFHNALGITAPLETRTRTYSGWHSLRDGFTELPLDHPRNTRPHQVIFGGRFVEAISALITDPAVKALRPQVGSVSQWISPSALALDLIPFCRGLQDDLLEPQAGS